MKTLLVAVVSLFLASCSSAPRGPDPGFSDRDIEALMARGQVVGLALALIDEGQVVKVAAYGKRNLERDLPLQPDTVMYGASLTKTAFAYMLLQLASEGRLDLDAPLTRLLPRPLPDYRLGERRDFSDLALDERWRQLTPRILLTHAGGFANFRWLEPDEKLRFHFDPGARYAYSAEGMYILQLIVEQGLGLDAGREMQVRVFDRLGMPNTAMRWRPDFAANLADGYTMEGKMEPHDQRSAVTAAGSMDTTIADQARMWAALVRGDALSAKLRAEMVRPQLPILSAGQFPTLVSRPGAQVEGLAAGLGVVTFQDRSGAGWFKGGHNDSTGNMAICLEARRRCLVMLSNDVRAERIFPEIARLALGENDMPWRWEYGWYGSAAQP
ncbi:serine hydrolase domain-containing protein [Massilia sp. CFBP9012]|uniref:serine hydrolase domain-containing protein n=1 Tax=Massilia sp. CFBP9012 TaxID=3096531 RepID=UPI002A6B7E68|nr:serine hydrolase domain-containing protein [Massilia sp. CFBP9012]MDY0975885.1 serine hydrolase domain-containing protein [Massilia sp. CFBP9012]